MWHQLHMVAESRRLPVIEFVEFAVGHAHRYDIIVDAGRPERSEVNTWNVDALVIDFKIEIGMRSLPRETWLDKGPSPLTDPDLFPSDVVRLAEWVAARGKAKI